MEEALRRLGSEDVQARWHDVRRLGITPGPEALAALIRRMEDPDPDLRGGAAVILGQRDEPEALDVLLEHLRSDPNSPVRACCAAALESFAEICPRQPVLDALRDPDPEVRRAASGVVSAWGAEAALPALRPLLEDPSWGVRYAASLALADLGERSAALEAALEELLRAPEQRGRFDSPDRLVTALEQLRSPATGTGPDREEQIRIIALERARSNLGAPDDAVRRSAVMAINQLGGPAEFPLLIPLLDDPSSQVRAVSALALGSHSVPAALAGLLDRLRYDPSRHVRRTTVVFLGFFSSFSSFAADAVLEALLGVLHDPDPLVRSGACASLGHSADARAIPGLLSLLEEPELEWNLRHSACMALVRLRAADARLVAALERLAGEPEAAESDLQTEEIRYLMATCPPEPGEPDPEGDQRLLKTGELLEEARRLLGSARGERDARAE